MLFNKYYPTHELTCLQRLITIVLTIVQWHNLCKTIPFTPKGKLYC